MSIKSSMNEVSNIRVLFYFPYNYKNRVLACFQTRPHVILNRFAYEISILHPNAECIVNLILLQL